MKDLNFLVDQPHGVRLRNGELQFPSILGFLGERGELIPARYREDPEIFVLRIILLLYCMLFLDGNHD